MYIFDKVLEGMSYVLPLGGIYLENNEDFCVISVYDSDNYLTYGFKKTKASKTINTKICKRY